MADKTLLELPLATTSSGALLYGVQNNEDKAFPTSVLLGNTAPQAANFVYAGPTAPPGGVPSFRRLVPNDIPDLSNLYMATTGGNLVSPNINNPNIIGGTISGTRITVDDDKWFLRNATDTTKVVRFNAASISPGQTRVITVPDASGELTLNSASQSLTNKNIVVNPSTTTSASFTIPHGSAPTTPVNGDIWTTSGGMYARISGVTVGPLAAEQTSYVTSFNTRTGAITLLPTDVTNALGYTPWNTSTNLVTSANISVGAITAAGVTNLNSDVNIKGALVTGVSGNAQLTVASDLVATYIESIRRDVVPGQRKDLNLYANGMSFIANSGTFYFDKGDGTNKVRFIGDGTNLQLQAINSGGTVFTPMLVKGSQVQLHHNDGMGVRVSSGYTEVFGSCIARPPNTNPGGGAGGFGYRSEGLYGGGYAMLDGSLWGGWWMSSGSMNWGINSGALTSLMSLSGGGALTTTGGFGPGSDPRLKDSRSLRTVDNALEKVYNLNVRYGKYQDWYNPDGKERVFLMADNALKQNIPQAVLKDAIEHEGEKYDGWSADQIIAFLVKAVQELTDKVTNLEEQINEQQSL